MRTFVEKPKANWQANSAKATLSALASFRQNREIGAIRHLQRTIGNQAVQRLLKANTRNVKGDSRPEIARFGHDFSRIPVRAPTPMALQQRVTKGITDGHHEQADDKEASNDKRAELLRQADATSGSPVEANIRQSMEQQLEVPLGNVRVHQGSASRAAAASISARAFAVGSNIHLGAEAEGMVGEQRRELLSHEIVHTVQQGPRPMPLAGRILVSSPHDPAEIEAADVAAAATKEPSIAFASPALRLRNAMRTTYVTPCIQRDIKGNKTTGSGKFEIDFTKRDGAAVGDSAGEGGQITFTPSATAPESDSIRFVQTVRNFDTTAGGFFDWTGTAQADLNKMRTKRDNAKNIAPGFHIDQRPDLLAKRTAKADPAVLPYYDAMLPNPANQIGKRRGKTIVPAILDDHPGANIPLKWNFVSSAKAADTGTWYGTVLWGMESVLDKKGILKIKNEYHSFRGFRGETTDAALDKFNEFYQNPGASTAPTK